jgi:protein TonB
MDAGLRALEAELDAIRYAERPSFAPELQAELARAWQARHTERHSPMLGRMLSRGMMAAGLAGLLLVATVPSARASLVKLAGALQILDPPPAAVDPRPQPEPVASVPEEIELEAPPSVPAAVAEAAPAPEEPARGGATVDPAGMGRPSAPRLRDRARAERLLQLAYPLHLQRDSIGGTVWLRLWVDEAGRGDSAALAVSSGEAALDAAALQVAPMLRFEPGMLGGAPIGTWIEFSVRFEPEELPAGPVAGPAADEPATAGPLGHRLEP